MPDSGDKTLMRSLGEFFGHVMKGIRTSPAEPDRTVVRKEVEEEDTGEVVLRRTTIEEIEFKKGTEGHASNRSRPDEANPDPPVG